jgi:hypothetical protein
MYTKSHFGANKMKLKKLISNFLLFSLILILIPLVFANSPGDYNETVNVTVNVTNAPPKIESITVPSPITLNPGTTKEVNCTVKVSDWNGYGDIKIVNATFWDNNSVLMSASDLNVTHYTNDNCTRTVFLGYNATYECTFDIQYYAYNSSNWICNATVLDNSTYNFTDSDYNITTINPLFAINVTNEIDFGEAAVGDTIGNKTANVTNFGNQAINISVEGYGITQNDGLAMNCAVNGNITVDNLKFSWATTALRQILSTTPTNITNVTIPKINQTGVNPGQWTNTYWDLYINPVNDPFGVCTGTVIFTAWNSI